MFFDCTKYLLQSSNKQYIRAGLKRTLISELLTYTRRVFVFIVTSCANHVTHNISLSFIIDHVICRCNSHGLGYKCSVPMHAKVRKHLKDREKNKWIYFNASLQKNDLLSNVFCWIFLFLKLHVLNLEWNRIIRHNNNIWQELWAL